MAAYLLLCFPLTRPLHPLNYNYQIVGLLRAVKRDWHRTHAQEHGHKQPQQQAPQATPREPAPASRGEEKHEGGGGTAGMVVEEAAAAAAAVGQQKAGSSAGPSVAYRRLEDAERRLLRLTK